MFCPNCGRDCKDFRFCPDCGMNLQEIAEENRQPVAEEQSFEERREILEDLGKLYCPKCLSVNIESKEIEPMGKEYLLYRSPYAQLAGNVISIFVNKKVREDQKKGPRNECLDCGYRWRPKLDGLVNRYRPHLEALLGDNESVVYHGEDGKKLTLSWDRLCLEYPEDFKGRPYEVWYWDLYCIKQDILSVYTDEPEPRWITICDKKRKRWPGPGTPKLAANDLYAILYEKSQIEEFRKIKDALNGIIEENKKAGLL